MSLLVIKLCLPKTYMTESLVNVLVLPFRGYQLEEFSTINHLSWNKNLQTRDVSQQLTFRELATDRPVGVKAV